ncbi:MAG: branched-chain amino acid transaminase [Anaerolineae bacterium]|nr:branched-chain amino acid transaminase [Anaerolineae bacterium]
MATATPTPKFAFFEGQIVPFAEANISIATHALHYGTGAFGGLRGYWNEEQEQLYVFRPADHFKRLLQSAKLLRMELPYDAPTLVGILTDLLRTEGLRQDCYIRPLVYKSTPTIGVRLHDLDDEIAIFAMPFGEYMAKAETGLHVTIASWRRIDDNAIPARGKITGAYINSALNYTDAKAAGFDDAIVLNEDGHVAEAAAANFFIVRDGVAITPPITANILEGITRRTVLQLLREELGVAVVERPVDRTEVYLADEAFSCGTGYQVAAVTCVDYQDIGTGKPGPITSKLRELYFKLVRGKLPQYGEWLQPIYATVPEGAD